jgi:CDP-diacylglycerol--glycerol-3-phosphate 3-phosphatidyltransferase
LCDALCGYAIPYDGHRPGGCPSTTPVPLRDEEARKRELELSLTRIFDGGRGRSHHPDPGDGNDGVVAWAIPTIQIPAAFAGNPACVPSDAEVTRNLLSSALGSGESSASVRLSSTYLNLTREMTSILSMYGRTGNNGDVGSSSSSSSSSPYILTAGAASHGFAPKVGSSPSSRGGKKRGVLERIKSTIPDAFLLLAKETARSIASSGGKILLYERRGWTFHAKGIWITTDSDDGDNDDDVDHSAPPPRRRRLDPRHHRPEIIADPSSLLATVIGSSNYGSRSENLDLESNCILIFNDDSSMAAGGGGLCGSSVKESVAAEWNELCRPSSVLRDVGDDEYGGSQVMRAVLKLMKRYL